MKEIVLNHPLITHKLTHMRKKETGTKDFRENLDEIAELMAYEVCRDLPVAPVEIETPVDSSYFEKINFVFILFSFYIKFTILNFRLDILKSMFNSNWGTVMTIQSYMITEW